MCVGKTPDVPTIPERQVSKAPQQPGTTANDMEARRKSMLRTILTSTAGATGALTTTATAGGGKGYLG